MSQRTPILPTLNGEAFVCPLAFQYELVAMNKKVQGYKTNLLGKPKYDDVWLES